MLRLSKKADYALIAMKHLALRGDRGSSSAREIAALYDIPIELMAKVLQRLVRRGLLVSQQGTRGGYHLSRPPRADHGRRRHPGDRRPGAPSPPARPTTVSASSSRNATCAIRCIACANGFWPRSASARSRNWRRIPRRRRPRDPRSFIRTFKNSYGRQTSDLHGLSRDDAVRSARRRGDAAVLHGALRQRREPQPSVRLGSGGGGREGAQAGRRPDRRQPEGNRLHQRRHRVRQPGDQGRRRDVPREGQPHHHRGDRAQGDPRHLQAPREGRLPRHLPAGAEGRPDQPRRAEGGDHRQDDPDHDHGRQQRDRRDPADRRDRRDREGEGDPLPHRRGADRRQGAVQRQRARRRTWRR